MLALSLSVGTCPTSRTTPRLLVTFTRCVARARKGSARIAVDEAPERDVGVGNGGATNIKRWDYSTEYLAERVNAVLADHLEEDLGTLAAKTRRVFGFPRGSIAVDGPA